MADTSLQPWNINCSSQECGGLQQRYSGPNQKENTKEKNSQKNTTYQARHQAVVEVYIYIYMYAHEFFG
jgi:hypothetical protein